jgi:ATP/ADP translocase
LAVGRLRRVWDVRQGEGARTALMFANVLLLIAAYTETKAVRDAVLLSRFGLTELSYIMIGIAVVAGFVVSLFTQKSAGVPRNRLIFGTNGFIAITLAAFAPGLQAGWAWLAWALYFWSGVFGLLIVAEFWLLANELFHAREARRLFPIIGAGAILGGVVGGALSGWLARPLGTANLLYLVAAQLVASAGLSHLAWKRRPVEIGVESRRTLPRFAEGLALVRNNRYVRLLALMMICMTVCMTLVQWQYKGIAKAHFGSRRDEMTSFFGLLAAVLNTASFLLQVLITPRLLRRFGVRAGLRVLPAGFLVGALLLIAATPLGGVLQLGAAVGAVLLSDGFRFSVDKASVELLYLPIPRAMKEQAKPFIDTVVDRFAGALAGFLWLFLTWAFSIDQPSRIGWASAVTAVLVLAWLLVISRARSGYVEAYRRMLQPEHALMPAHPRMRECEALLAFALKADAPARTRTLRTLGRRLRGEAPLRLGRNAIEPLLEREATEAARLARALRAQPQDRLLARLLRERFDQGLERIARLLALVYPPRDILTTFRALRSLSRAARAGALELLDNLLEGGYRSELLQAFDDVLLVDADAPPGAEAERRAALAALIRDGDPWLRACAERACAQAQVLEGDARC